ncbi:ABC transporter ATP-binding protein [Desulfovibrio sulfodismutans]|uniref:ABC transporter ATP-binding protein n=1 Tax=Desulfolutivibrio sulfodismutans TaxID=63561 RepID=A0A7K3NRL9_9BACT|nr:oligopeptide/dipeptide ABC transporter ATP-binding protein [Desulfolutivibrio sulfodismutans]NDY58844.1 ABC transporter ATP-binding protein [Desulfolutivibrio sulfodismutans]QLA10848.1 ATP-binding cassette domain-containing protein [Desulfolutivibrio sulfodismutans DSM 3696]
MIAIDDLGVRHGETPVLAGVSLTLVPGRPVALVGESGAGKTSLALALMRLSPGQVHGRLRIDGEDVMAFDAGRLRRYRGGQAALVVQAVGEALNPHMRVLDQVVEAMTCQGTAAASKAATRALALLAAQGIEEDTAARYPAGLSGGETQRILLAMALANDPALLILDEPTAALDPASRATALATIKEAARDRCVLFITHDFAAVRDVAVETAVLYGGRLVEHGPTREVLAAPRHPYTRGLVRALPERHGGKDLQGVPGVFARPARGCLFANRCPQAVAVCREMEPRLNRRACGHVCDHGRDHGHDHVLACHRGGIVAAMTVRGLTKSLGGRRILDGLDLTLGCGETVVVCGESGSGKSTLARILAGLETPDGGGIAFDDAPGRVNHGGLALAPQHPHTAIAAHFSIAEAVAEPLVCGGMGDAARREAQTAACLAAVHLPTDKAFLRRRAHSLSGGELQRVAVARALVQDPAVLVADEATSALDVSVQAKIVRLLMELQEKRGLAMLFITHDMALARRVADRILVMDHGRLRPASGA